MTIKEKYERITPLDTYIYKICGFISTSVFIVSCSTVAKPAHTRKEDCWEKKLLYCELSRYCQGGCDIEVFVMIGYNNCDRAREGLEEMTLLKMCVDGVCGKKHGGCAHLLPSDSDGTTAPVKLPISENKE